MTPNFTYYGQYGVATTLYFTVPDILSSSSNRFLSAAVPWVAGDVKISKDGGAVANVTNLPTRVGSTPLYTITITATEMQAEWVVVYLVDADGPAWRDTVIVVNTKLKLGQMHVDATQIGSNTSAIYAKGVGTGVGLQLEGATDAFISNLFEQLEGTEPSSEPADNASFGAIFQELKRRFANKIAQTRTSQTGYKDDSVTVRWTRTINEDGSTFTIGKVS